MNIKLFVLSTALATSSLFSSIGTTKIETQNAPIALGPYSQGVMAGEYIFVSGQIAINPTTGKMGGKTIEEQTWLVLSNIEAILAAKGLSLENVVKCDVYLKDLKDFSAMNQVYGEMFSYSVNPARATVQVSMLPHDALIEISCIAYQDR